MSIYFKSRRHAGHVTHVSDPERLKIDVDIFDVWREECRTTARCGNTATTEIERSVGISITSSDTLKQVIESNIGAAGVLSVKNQIEKTLGHAVNWSITKKTKKIFTQGSPKCGRDSLIIYQLKREYEITLWRKVWRPFVADRWDMVWSGMFVEDTDEHDAIPDLHEYDEVCKCPRPADTFKPEGRLCFRMGNISFRVPFRFTNNGADVQLFSNLVTFLFSNYSDDVAWLTNREIRSVLPASYIPQILRFLGNITGDTVNTYIFRYVDADEENIKRLIFIRQQSAATAIKQRDEPANLPLLLPHHLKGMDH